METYISARWPSCRVRCWPQRAADRFLARLHPHCELQLRAWERPTREGLFPDCAPSHVYVQFVVGALHDTFSRLVASAFTSDGKLIAAVEQTQPVFLAGMTIFGLKRACQNMFVALGQAKVSVFIALLRKVILLVRLALLCHAAWA